MRLLYVVPGQPVVPDFSGASSRFYQDLAALLRIANETHVLRLCAPGELKTTREFEQNSELIRRMREAARSWQDVEYPSERTLLAGGTLLAVTRQSC